jgi:hypothetical protein
MHPGNNEGLLCMNLRSLRTWGTIRPSCSPHPPLPGERETLSLWRIRASSWSQCAFETLRLSMNRRAVDIWRNPFRGEGVRCLKPKGPRSFWLCWKLCVQITLRGGTYVRSQLVGKSVKSWALRRNPFGILSLSRREGCYSTIA